MAPFELPQVRPQQHPILLTEATSQLVPVLGARQAPLNPTVHRELLAPGRATIVFATKVERLFEELQVPALQARNKPLPLGEWRWCIRDRWRSTQPIAAASSEGLHRQFVLKRNGLGD